MGAWVDDVPSDWYTDAFSAASTALLPSTDHAAEDVDRVLEILEPRSDARILDLACGTGRHSIELARRGFGVVGVDISQDQLDMVGLELDLRGEEWLSLDVEYKRADLRDLEYDREFDVVLNLHSGAVGYFENDAENRRTFAIIAQSLRPGGRTLMQLPNVLHAERLLPAKTWTEGKWAIELLDRHWNPESRCVEGTITPIVLEDPGLYSIPFRQRLYSVDELFEIFASVGMSLEAAFADDGERSGLSEEAAEIYVVARRD